MATVYSSGHTVRLSHTYHFPQASWRIICGILRGRATASRHPPPELSPQAIRPLIATLDLRYGANHNARAVPAPRVDADDSATLVRRVPGRQYPVSTEPFRASTRSRHPSAGSARWVFETVVRRPLNEVGAMAWVRGKHQHTPCPLSCVSARMTKCPVGHELSLMEKKSRRTSIDNIDDGLSEAYKKRIIHRAACGIFLVEVHSQPWTPGPPRGVSPLPKKKKRRQRSARDPALWEETFLAFWLATPGTSRRFRPGGDRRVPHLPDGEPRQLHALLHSSRLRHGYVHIDRQAHSVPSRAKKKRGGAWQSGWKDVEPHGLAGQDAAGLSTTVGRLRRCAPSGKVRRSVWGGVEGGCGGGCSCDGDLSLLFTSFGRGAVHRPGTTPPSVDVGNCFAT